MGKGAGRLVWIRSCHSEGQLGQAAGASAATHPQVSKTLSAGGEIGSKGLGRGWAARLAQHAGFRHQIKIVDGLREHELALGAGPGSCVGLWIYYCVTLSGP